MDTSAGSISEGGRKILLETTGEFSSVDEIGETVVSYSAAGAPGRAPSLLSVRLQDIAEVYESYKDQSTEVFINGEPGIFIQLQKQSRVNSVQVADRVKERILEINETLPAGVELELVYDSTKMIRSSLQGVSSSALLGAGLAMIVLFIFLRNIKTRLSSGCHTHLIAGDPDADVLRRHHPEPHDPGGPYPGGGDDRGLVHRHPGEYLPLPGKGHQTPSRRRAGNPGDDHRHQRFDLTTVSVFLPVIMFKADLDMIGIIFQDMAFTIVITLLTSLIIAVTLVPVLSSKFLPIVTRSRKPLKEGLLKRVDTAMEGFFHLPGQRLQTTAGLPAESQRRTAVDDRPDVHTEPHRHRVLGIELMPAAAEDVVQINLSLPPGTALDETKDWWATLNRRCWTTSMASKPW
jgi:HAE1 family hydrophobic/amphiphilic exporter-1